MYPDDDQARELLSEALETMDRYYKERGYSRIAPVLVLRRLWLLWILPMVGLMSRTLVELRG